MRNGSLYKSISQLKHCCEEFILLQGLSRSPRTAVRRKMRAKMSRENSDWCQLLEPCSSWRIWLATGAVVTA